MTANQPVLVSIKNNWESIVEPPLIGKDVLELLSSSMYVNPLSIFREYVQNAADAIEEASALGLLNRRDTGRVDIRIDPDNRTVRIRDNGTGISKAAFTKALVALGASRKRGTKARGFRGVGRLGGLGYCQELIFRSRFDGERETSEMRWDCRRLKSILRDSAFAGNVEDLIRDVVRVHRVVESTAQPHFFEVELCGMVRHGDDRLVSARAVRDYLCQVAPVPFSPSFRFGKNIDEFLRERVNLGTIHIYFEDNGEPLFRPHQHMFNARKSVQDHFTDVQFYKIPGQDGELAAVGWVLDHGYLGAIDAAAAIKGLRLRSGNMQVGESNVLDELFVEPRFNSWVVGEFHVIDDRILPNGRRDHFEQNVHFGNLVSQLRPIAEAVSRRCRQSSIHRNINRQFNMLSQQVAHNLSVISQGAIGPAERRRLQREILKDFKRMEGVGSHSILTDPEKARMGRVLNRYRRRLSTIDQKGEHKALSAMEGRDRKIVTRVFSILYECSMNKAAAKLLIDRILARW
jgi:Histidine kinase-, DNA gyrase B-, and HSP90-like ATPase